MKTDEQMNGCVMWRIMEVHGLAKNSFFRFICRKCKVSWCLFKKRSNVEHSETEILNIGWIQTPHIWLKQLSMLPVLTCGMIDKEGLQRCENGYITFWIRWFSSLLFHRILTTLYMSVTSSGTNQCSIFLSNNLYFTRVLISSRSLLKNTIWNWLQYITCGISINISVFVYLQSSKKWGSTKACSWDINVDQHITLIYAF